MTSYRAYMLNEHGRIFHREDDVEATDDTAAIAAGWMLFGIHNAQEAKVAHGVEVWRGTKLIFSSRARSV